MYKTRQFKGILIFTSFSIHHALGVAFELTFISSIYSNVQKHHYKKVPVLLQVPFILYYFNKVITTRLFFALPAKVLLSAIGLSSPLPITVWKRDCGIPFFLKKLTTACARFCDRS